MTGMIEERSHPGSIGNHRAMTLIELILVMALLAVVLGVSSPMLSGFFAGRRSSEEARRFLALTRFAREEAVSSGSPREVWIDAEETAYGLRSTEEELADNAPARTYHLSEGLTIEIDGETETDEEGRFTILYLPDGTMEDGAPSSIRLVEKDEKEIVIERSGISADFSIQ